jgi:hypothetical protein
MTKSNPKRKSASGDAALPSPLLKLMSKVLLAFFVVLIFLTLIECTVKKPEAPEWNTSVVVPVLNRTYTMAEIVEKVDQEGLGMDGDSNVVYSISYDINPLGLSQDNLSTDDLSFSASDALGTLTVSAPTISPITTTVADIPALDAVIPGVVPALSFDLPNNEVLMGPNFSRVWISQGRVYIVVDNRLGINLDVLSVELWDLDASAQVSTGSFPGGVATGETDSVLMILDGVELSDSLEVRTSCHNQAATVISSSGLELVTSILFDGDLTVDSAIARIPAQPPVNFSQQAALSGGTDTVTVYHATLTNGIVDLQLDNNTPLDANLIISLPDLDSSGTKFATTRAVTAGTNTSLSVDLTNYDLMPVDSSFPQTIDVNVTANVPGSGTNQVTVSSTDDFSVVATVSNLSFGEVTGLFTAEQTDFPSFTEQLDIPEGFDAIELASVVLTLEIENGVNLPGSVDILLSDGAGKTLNVSGNIDAGTIGGTVTSTITVVDSTFLSPVPDSIVVTGTATFGGQQGTITAADSVWANVSLTAPLDMIINDTHIDTDIESESIEQEDIDIITDHVVEARFIYSIENHLPIGADVQILLGGDTTTLAGDTNRVIPQLTLGENGEISIAAAPVVGGIVPADSVALTGELTILLDSVDIQVLKNDPLFIGPDVTLLGSNGQRVRLTKDDYIRIVGRIEVDYRFDGEF